MGAARTDALVRSIEVGLAAIGVACLTWVGTVAFAAVGYQAAQRVLLERPEPPAAYPTGDRPSHAAPGTREFAGTIGHLHIPRIGLSAIVREGDDEHTLKIAVGHLPDTPLPWQDGNAALAAHRDTFFRPLRRIRTGDDIRLTTSRGVFRYRVTRHTVVDPDELWVLDRADRAALTLITCYPFDILGPAPRRFVVHAERITDDPPARTADAGGAQTPGVSH